MPRSTRTATHLEPQFDDIPKAAWIGIPDLALWINDSEGHIRHMVRTGRIPFTKVSSRVRFHVPTIIKWLEANSVPAGGDR